MIARVIDGNTEFGARVARHLRDGIVVLSGLSGH
jgi:hypothetical protein